MQRNGLLQGLVNVKHGKISPVLTTGQFYLNSFLKGKKKTPEGAFMTKRLASN
jgi:hypothetical protein